MFKNSTFYPLREIICFGWISEQAVITSTCINSFSFIIGMDSFYCALSSDFMVQVSLSLWSVKRHQNCKLWLTQHRHQDHWWSNDRIRTCCEFCVTQTVVLCCGPKSNETYQQENVEPTQCWSWHKGSHSQPAYPQNLIPENWFQTRDLKLLPRSRREPCPSGSLRIEWRLFITDFSGQPVPFSCLLKRASIDCLETSVRNNSYLLRNNPEERSSDSKRDFILICQFRRQKKKSLS